MESDAGCYTRETNVAVSVSLLCWFLYITLCMIMYQLKSLMYVLCFPATEELGQLVVMVVTQPCQLVWALCFRLFIYLLFHHIYKFLLFVNAHSDFCLVSLVLPELRQVRLSSIYKLASWNYGQAGSFPSHQLQQTEMLCKENVNTAFMFY